ncbi:hypothetical protein [Streptomyces sp. NPDC051921]|uniref:hypothetical protein n=1 Tax=Streptomyces sp. NPDC051921 TaxID=3155806 RepID=UPI0034278B1D
MERARQALDDSGDEALGAAFDATHLTLSPDWLSGNDQVEHADVERRPGARPAGRHG